jgi:mRNA interferase MazF
MRLGYIYMAYLDPSVDSEQGGRRPVVIISGNTVNKFAPNVVVCPLTTSIKNYHGDVIIKPGENNGLKKKSEILNIHVRSISKSRLKEYIGCISKSEIFQIHEGINDVFTL